MSNDTVRLLEDARFRYGVISETSQVLGEEWAKVEMEDSKMQENHRMSTLKKLERPLTETEVGCKCEACRLERFIKADNWDYEMRDVHGTARKSEEEH